MAPYVPLISLLALVVAIAVGFIRKVNTGIVSMALAFPIGCCLGGMNAGDIVAGWPLQIFFVLMGVMFLFSIAGVNGTLRLVAQKVTFLAGGHRALIPVVFFVMCMVLAAIGPGNIAVAALVLPIAMAVSAEEKISPLLMATMVIAGCNAGGLSPIAPTGIIGVTLAKQQNLDIGFPVFLKQVLGQSILGAILYFALRGHRLKRKNCRLETPRRFTHQQILTICVVLLVVAAMVATAAMIGLNAPMIGLMAFLGGAVLILLKAADENEAIASMPWSTLILVCGVGVLINVCSRSGGIDYLTGGLAKLMTRQTVGPVMAVTGGVMTIFSSASGVVMPTLIPTVPQLVHQVGGNPTDVISAIIMGAHMVTNSPLTTLGALAMASAGPEVNKTRLFRNLLILALFGLLYAAVIVAIGVV